MDRVNSGRDFYQEFFPDKQDNAQPQEIQTFYGEVEGPIDPQIKELLFDTLKTSNGTEQLYQPIEDGCMGHGYVDMQRVAFFRFPIARLLVSEARSHGNGRQTLIQNKLVVPTGRVNGIVAEFSRAFEVAYQRTPYTTFVHRNFLQRQLEAIRVHGICGSDPYGRDELTIGAGTHVDALIMLPLFEGERL